MTAYPRHSSCFLVLLLSFAACVSATGCASFRGKSGPPLDVWRQKVTNYVAAEGYGDPNCLRDTADIRSRRTARPAVITFSSLNSSYQDARGVLVGQSTASDRPWYFFLVAVQNNDPAQTPRIVEMRPIAFYADAEGLHWLTGAPDGLAQQKYVASRYPQSTPEGPQLPESFPGPVDRFHLAVSGTDVTITEERSRATWSLKLPGSAFPRSASADENQSGASSAVVSPTASH